jgi:D-amino-acid dehydrogenase
VVGDVHFVRGPVIAMSNTNPAPQDVAVVGAGIVGLSVAWFLQERGVTVTVYDADRVGAGASWGNAGWLTPALTAPLPAPGVLRYGLGAVLKPSSPVYVPPRLDPALWRFLLGFTRHSTKRQWARGAAAYAPINRLAIRAFDDLADAGAVPRPRPARPFLACYRTTRDAAHMLHELTEISRAGTRVHYDYLTGPQVRQAQPGLSEEVGAAVSLHGQRYIHPPDFVRSLAHSVIGRGGKVQELFRVAEIAATPTEAWLVGADGIRHRHDAVVVANGTALNTLARPFGVRRVVQAGRGYSFSVTGEEIPTGPVYFPDQRVACTPLHEPHEQGDTELFRVAGMMEFRRSDEPLDQRRIEAIVAAVRDLLPGLDFTHRYSEWVGSRPCTTDGLPLIGATTSPRVHVAGGHGMWGVALGPATGKLLAEQITSGHQPEALAPFDPVR